MGMTPFGGGFDAMFTIIPVIVGIGFVVVIGMVIYNAIKSGAEWKNNNNSPVLTVDATVVTKRTDVRTHRSDGHHHHGHNHGTGHAQGLVMSHHSANTTYFVTFEVESGDRMEFKISDKEYGMLADGDKGKLTFQGTRYKEFARVKDGVAQAADRISAK